MAFEEGLADLVVAKEVATANVISVTPHMSLNDAMGKFVSIDVDQLPVVDEKSPRRPIGILSRGDIIAAYNRRVLMRNMGK